MKKRLVIATIAASLTVAGCANTADTGPVSSAADTTIAHTVAFDEQEVINTCVAGINGMEENVSNMAWLEGPEVYTERADGGHVKVTGLASIETAVMGRNMYDVSCMVNIKGDTPDVTFAQAEPLPNQTGN